MAKLIKSSNNQELAHEKSYCEQRLDELAITPELNQLTAESFFDDYTQNILPIFAETSNGNISIRYAGINGWKSYLYEGKTEKPYIRERKNPINCTNNDHKYHTPKGAGVEIFIPSVVLNAYQEKQEIKTLIVTEGEFKAFKACMHGFYCIGLQGIHNFGETDVDGNKILNTELSAIISRCQVENVILLFDADCMSVNYEPDKDLFKRPNSFYSAVKNFREYCKPLNVDVYFSHIKTDSEYKGIDDLLVANKGKEDDILKALLGLKKISDFFNTRKIGADNDIKIKTHFFIDKVDKFYEEYKDIIKNSEFLYCNDYYKYDNDKLTKLFPEALKRFVRVGDEYYEELSKPDKIGNLERVFSPRKKNTITDDFGRDCIGSIKKYKDFCYVPSHTNHQQEVAGFFNKYHKLSHIPKEGTTDNVLKLLEHIFGEHLDFILDYLKIMYEDPTQPLPIVILESKERNTGKSTAVQFLLDIFELNGTKLGNVDIQGDFNAFWIEKLLVVVDETSLEKKATGEMLKRLSTEKGKAIMNAKNKAQIEVDFCGKFFFCTNKEGESLTIEKEETRYAVFKVPKLTDDDVDLSQKIKAEIPAFIHFLLNRKMKFKREGRMYFGFEVYKTDALEKYFEKSTNSVERAIRELIIDTFDAFEELAITELSFSYNDMILELKDSIKWIATKNIKDVLPNLKHSIAPKQGRYTYYSLKMIENADASLNLRTESNSISRNNKPIIFQKQDYLPSNNDISTS